jgi:DNA-binding transcriptional ArsR family regulator
MDVALKAIAEPRRRAILKLVWEVEQPAGAIAAHLSEITHAAVSQHLRVLKEAGLVSERRDGRHRYYRARRAAIVELRSSLEAFWDEGLERLRAVVELEERSKRERKR